MMMKNTRNQMMFLAQTKWIRRFSGEISPRARITSPQMRESHTDGNQEDSRDDLFPLAQMATNQSISVDIGSNISRRKAAA